MRWREDELSRADVFDRQMRLQAAIRGADLGALIVYTNHVRSAGVTYVTGFTPYWSDALLLLPTEGQAVFATALSKRVGNWIKSTNPTAEIAHSPQPGRLVGERLAANGVGKVGVVELDHLPGGLVDEICAAAPAIELVDASAVFASVRTVPDAAELQLAAKADAIAAAAFAQAPRQPALVGDVTEVLELNVRNAGAEECYVAIAPDLRADVRLARTKGRVALGPYFAVRLSVAYNGVWIRRTESFARTGGDEALTDAGRWADALAVALRLAAPLGAQITGAELPAGLRVENWTLEAPIGTRPLQRVALPTAEAERGLPYGVLAMRLASARAPLLLARAIGTAGVADRDRSAA
jgi:Creatinase/Prolidase N-terminal domain